LDGQISLQLTEIIKKFSLSISKDATRAAMVSIVVSIQPGLQPFSPPSPPDKSRGLSM
jgi:hypothetical protein